MYCTLWDSVLCTVHWQLVYSNRCDLGIIEGGRETNRFTGSCTQQKIWVMETTNQTLLYHGNKSSQYTVQPDAEHNRRNRKCSHKNKIKRNPSTQRIRVSARKLQQTAFCRDKHAKCRTTIKRKATRSARGWWASLYIQLDIFVH